MDEFTGTIEQKVLTDLKLGLQLVLKYNRNLCESLDPLNGYDPTATDENGLIWLPYTITDPGWDGEWGTDDDQPLTVYGLRDDPPLNRNNWRTNPPEAKKDYWALIFTFDKKMSRNWQIKGSILYSSYKSMQPGEQEDSSSLCNNPNAMVNAWGPIGYDRPFQAKLMGTVILPYDFVLSGYFWARSGSPWTRSISRIYFPPDMPVQASYASVYPEPKGSRRNASSTNLDLRLEKSFTFGEFGRLRIFVDAFNVAGSTGVNVTSNQGMRIWYYRDPPEVQLQSQYGAVTSVSGVRSVRLGARFTF